MNKIQNLIFLIFLLYISDIAAQNFKLGKVSENEIQVKHDPNDSLAAASILFQKGDVTFRYTDSKVFEMKTEVTTRIKIYKEQGYEWANPKIEYFSDDKIIISDGVTYNLINGEIIKSKLNLNSVKDVKVSKGLNRKEFEMPNVKEGSVIEYKYVITTTKIKNFNNWYFQYKIPVQYSEFITNIPEYFTFNINQKGNIPIKKQIIKEEQTLNKLKRKLGFATSEQIAIGNTYLPKDKTTYESTQTRYIAENVAGIPFSQETTLNEKSLAPLTHVLVKEAQPDSPEENYSMDWQSLVSSIYNENIIAELNKSKYYQKDLDIIIKNNEADHDRIQAIFNSVKQNILWDKTLGYEIEEGVENVYKNKKGNASEINLVCIDMLRAAGIKASPILISTKSNGEAFTPNKRAFNLVIVGIEKEGQTMLLDASDKFSSIDILPIRDLNGQGVLIDKGGNLKTIDLIPNKKSNYSISLSYEIANEGSIKGKARRFYTDYAALEKRSDDTDEKKSVVFKDVVIDQYKKLNLETAGSPVNESFLFETTSYLEKTENTFSLKPLMFFSAKQEDPKFPSYPIIINHTVIIQIPEGYIVEKLPEVFSLKMDNDWGVFKYIAEIKGNQVYIMAVNEITEVNIPVEYYSMLKEYALKVFEKENEPIVFKKQL